MASTYSTNLALELMATGEKANTWGDITNTNLGTLLEQSISGYVTQAITDGSSATTTITIPNGATGVARNMFIEMTGALTFSTTSLVVPANKKLYFIYNNTSGGYPVQVKVSGQTGVAVPNGQKVVLVSNGTDVVVATNYMATLAIGALTSGRVPYATTAGLLTDSSSLTFNGTKLTVGGLLDSALTSGRVPYATTSGELTDAANLTFNGTTLTAGGLSSPTLTNAGTLALSATGANVVTASTNGSERMRIDSSGNVGIGTSAPSSPLNVVSASSSLAIAINGRSSDGLGAMYFYANNGSTQYATITTSATEFRSSSVPAAAVQTFYTNGAERLRITSNGGVSFGATGTAYGTAGQVLQSNGDAPPTWATASGITTGKSIAMAMIFGF